MSCTLETSVPEESGPALKKFKVAAPSKSYPDSEETPIDENNESSWSSIDSIGYVEESENEKIVQEERTVTKSCSFCGRTFNKLARLTRHMRSHTGDKPFKCSVDGCNNAYTRKDHLTRHISTHTGQCKFVCLEPNCGKKYYESSHLSRHVKIKHTGLEPYVCDVEIGEDKKKCGTSFSLKKYLRKHQSEEHSVLLRCNDENCNMSFPTKSKLERHKVIHTRVHMCGEVGCTYATFKSLKELQSHARMNHAPICQFCNKSLISSRQIRDHRCKAMVASEKKNEEKSENMDEIARKIADVTNHICTIDGCGRGYTTSSNLNKHIREIHENYKPHVCHVESCGRMFMIEYNLRRHMQTCHKAKEACRGQDTDADV